MSLLAREDCFASLSGAVLGLTKMGENAIKMLVLPTAPSIVHNFASQSRQGHNADLSQDVQRLQGSLLLACSLCINLTLKER